MERLELLWELVQQERLVRWSAIAALGLVWLAAAWLSPLPLLVAAALGTAVYVVRRRRGEPEPRDRELDLL